MTAPKNEVAVSVIIGTLLLILITVTAAAGLALMVSQMQKDEMNRQTHLNAVKNENITILNVAFENNQTEWNLTGVQNSQNWSSVKLTLVNMNIDAVRVMGIAINDRYALNFTDKSRTDPSVSSRTISNSTNYLTVPATGSRDVYIDFVANASDDPAGLIDYTQAQYFSVGNSQNIKIGTSLTNFFERTLKPPNPVYQMSIESENLGSVQRDVLILDGSKSTADNSINRWNWTIYDRSMPLNVISSNPMTNWTNLTFYGKTVRITTLNNTPNYWGTLTVTDSIGMTAASDYFAIPSGNQFSPPTNLQLAINIPALCVHGCPYQTYTNSSATSALPIQIITNLSATLYNINNNPVINTPVIFIIDNNPNTPQDCFTIFPMASNTDQNGVAYTTVTQSNTTNIAPPLCLQPITMHAQAGKLNSPTILIPGIT
jgi:hypothetical protein